MTESKPLSSIVSDSHKHHDVFVRRISAGNPGTSEPILASLSEDDAHKVRHRVAENPHTPPAILARLARDRHVDVRLAVAENSHSPPELLAELASDHSADVRYGVAENPHMPEHILFTLAEDENPYVRCRAQKTLQLLSPDVQARLRALLQHNHGVDSSGL